MKHNRTYHLVVSGLLTSVGLLLPYITSHMFGIPGTVLLPMHIPVLLIGLICGPVYGTLGGLIIPVLSSVLTGMPPAFPMLPIMSGELATYGFAGGLIHQKTKKVYLSMILAMICGRIVYGIIFEALLMLNEGTLRALSIYAAFIQGLPGIAIQLIIVPIIVKLAIRHNKNNNTRLQSTTQLSKAKRRIQNGQATCVVLRNGVIVRETSGKGVKPILQLYENEPAILRGAEVADKVIGKAAAMLLVLAGVNYVYGELMSVAARQYLKQHSIKAEYGRCIDVISNRTGNGICPLEKSVLNLNDPQDGYFELKKTIAVLMATS